MTLFDKKKMEINPVLDDDAYGEASSSRDYMEHHVSKLDTLPGLAIKYGVEVADIKRLNGLATDFQMYARKILQIPLHGRHPPSESLMNDSTNDNPRCTYSEPRPRVKKQIYPSFYTATKQASASALVPSDGRNVARKKVASAMGLLHGYYGLSTSGASDCDGTEVLLYRSDQHAYSDDEPFTPPSVSGDPRSHKFSFLNGISPPSSGRIDLTGKNERRNETSISLAAENGSNVNNMHSHKLHTSGVPEIDGTNENVVRRRTKVEGGENNEGQDSGPGNSFVFAGKSPAPKPKTFKSGSEMESEGSAVRLLPFAWAPSGGNSTIETGSESKGLGGNLLGGITVEDLISKIKRSASTSYLQDEKKDSQGNSAYNSGSQELSDAPSEGPMANIARPFLEGLVKPSNRRNKAALD